MIIASWNINSIRIRVDQVINYLKKEKIDILLLQEIKTEDKNFPHDEFKKRDITHTVMDKNLIMVSRLYLKKN